MINNAYRNAIFEIKTSNRKKKPVSSYNKFLELRSEKRS